MKIGTALLLVVTRIRLGLAALMVCASTSAPAAILIDTAPVNFSAFGPSLSGQLDLFNPALGTLNRVDLSIIGGLTVTSATPVCVPDPFIPCAPLPYRFQLQLDIAGLGGGYFAMDDATMIFTGVVPPVTPAVSDTRAFSLGLRFDAATDLIGFDVPSPFTGFDIPALAFAQRSDFLDTPFPLDQLVFSWTPTDLLNATPFQLTGAAVITVQYDYTPATPPVPVNEPPTALMWLAVLLAWPVARRRKAGRSQQP